ncbi:NAD-dependent epimerase/dehydratase family protein [Mesobacillus foraminis]|uniref:NAD-dependent epimerase/dehydratase family protein n=1 Tax=Mesobacillus foraminis TaxID=279826 RepID=UPI001BE5F4F9|nr:NAD-dependent epimerase/dehydratase family protein [Mesobacillus foraminis]MBT2756690.1 NAD-dependent epimerase/dehydratase family protein [Mesobacillus foraminis]
MKVLILGGTRFLGRALTEEGLKRGHELTLFNRGTNTGVFPDVEQLNGNRDSDVSILQNRKWEAVIDTCGFAPHHIKKMVAALGDHIEHYTYISSISVYNDWVLPGITEDYPLHSSPAEDVLKGVEEGKISPYEHYGALKVLCEQEAEKHWPGKVLNVRAGQLVGPFDYTDRLPYWVRRIAQGSKVLVPGRPDRPVQLIDVKDVAAWVFDMAERKKAGTFNVTGPDAGRTMEDLVNTCKNVANSDADFVWTDEQFLLDQNVQPWTQLPLWVPENFPLEGETQPWKGAFTISVEKAVNAGLSFRPLEETIRDVYQWEMARPEGERKAGITRAREQELLEAWAQIEKGKL